MRTSRSAIEMLIRGSAELDLKVGRHSLNKFRDALAEAQIGGMLTMSQKASRDYYLKMKGAYDKIATLAREKNNAAAQAEAKRLAENFKLELERTHKLVEQRKKAFEDLAKREKNHQRQREKWGEVERFAENLRGGNLTSVVEKISQVMADQGKKMMKAGVTDAEKNAGGLTKVVRNLGGLLAKVGPAILTISSIGLGLAAVIKIALDAEAAVKEFNKGLLEAGLSITDFAKGSKDIAGNLKQWYSAFSGTGMLAFRNQMNLSSEDMTRLAGAFASAGVGLEKMTKGAVGEKAQLQSLQETFGTVARNAALFGTSVDEMAGVVAEWSHSLGENLNSVEGGFNNIFHAAVNSGYGLKKFFGMVQQVTSGMTMYNVRLNETAGLLSKVGKVLGAEGGSSFVQQLQTSARDSSITDRLRQNILVGSEILDRRIANQIDADLRDLYEKLRENGAGAPLLRGATSAEAFASMFKSMSAADRDQYRRSVGAVDLGDSGAAWRKVVGLEQLFAARGGDDWAKARASGNLSAGNMLAMQIHGMAAAFQGKTIDQLNDVEMAAFEQNMGKQGSEGHALYLVAKRARDEFERNRKTNPNLTFDEVLARYGEEYVKSQEGLDPKKLAEEQLKETRSLNDMISNSIAAILKEIQGHVGEIVSMLRRAPFLGADRATIEREDQAKALERIRAGKGSTKDYLALITSDQIGKRSWSGYNRFEGVLEDVIKKNPELAKDPKALVDVMRSEMRGHSKSLRNIHARDFLNEMSRTISTSEMMASRSPMAQDLVMQIGSRGVKFAQRVSPNDVGVFAKPGGALSQVRPGASGAGGSVNVFHLYGEGPGVLNTIVRAQQAGILG